MRGVPSEIAEKTIIDSLAQEFSNVRVTRFVKRDKTVLGTDGLTFFSAEDAAKAKNQGQFNDHLLPTFLLHTTRS